jgi:NAD dependent epimerase/dehydratase family enzyme
MKESSKYVLYFHILRIGFLANVCEAWEKEALKAESNGIRTVLFRLAPIFSKQGGIIAKLLPIFQLGAGGIIGTGKQGFSWVSIDDVVRAIDFAVETNAVKGPVNVCSPEPVTNQEFTTAFGKLVNSNYFETVVIICVYLTSYLIL